MCLSGASEQEAVREVLEELGTPQVVRSGLARLYTAPLTVGLLVLRRITQRLPESVLIIAALAMGAAALTAVTAKIATSNSSIDWFLNSLEARQITIRPSAGLRDPRIDAYHVGSIYDAASQGDVAFRYADLEQARQAAPSVDYAWRDVHELEVLLICLWELDALKTLIGSERATTVIENRGYYTWIYQTVLSTVTASEPCLVTNKLQLPKL